MEHKPECATNMTCSVMHLDGVCSGFPCNCGAKPEPTLRDMTEGEKEIAKGLDELFNQDDDDLEQEWLLDNVDGKHSPESAYDWWIEKIKARNASLLAFIESQKKELEMQSDGEYHFVNNAKVASHNHALELVEKFIKDNE